MEISCTKPTPNFSSGRALLLHYEHNGKIDGISVTRANDDAAAGRLTSDELDFVNKCWNTYGGGSADICCPASTPITSGICDWISAKGGKTNIGMFDVLDIIGAYKGTTNIGFTPKTFDVVGVLAYYKGEVSDGDTFITC